MKKTQKIMIVVGSALMLLVGQSDASEGIAPEWNVAVKPTLQYSGDYEGEWLDAPKGHIYEFNKPIAAQVVPVRDGLWTIQFFQQHDSRADFYVTVDGKEEQGTIRFQGNGCSGVVQESGIVGTAPDAKGQQIRFELKKVIRTSPTMGMAPPAGAVVLFDGKDLNQWEHDSKRPATWRVLENGVMEIRSAHQKDATSGQVGGDLATKQSFGDCQFHMEFRYPWELNKKGQGRGNGGVFFQNKNYEIQILNSYGLQGTWNECGALYKVRPPQVNMARVAGEWQTYDVDFKAAVWKDGKRVSAARFNVRHNGVWIHKDEELPYATAWRILDRGEDRNCQGPGPIRLQDHSNPLQFRNIWVVPAKASVTEKK